MRHSRAKANRLTKGKRISYGFKEGQKGWAWDMGREGNLGDKLKPWWIGPCVLGQQMVRAMWKVKLLEGLDKVYHSDHLRLHRK